MNSKEIRERFIKFFESRGHTIVPSSSLIPDDPSVLLTTAGMQQFKAYYSELDPEKTIHPSIGRPLGKNAISIQKSFRTSDIDEVGDESHLTFFEMMGNFSFGDYFKKEAISYAHEFITKELGLSISYVTVFGGFGGVPKDEESRAIWQALDIIDIREEGMEDVFWGPTGNAGPCGPTTEIYLKNGRGQDIETWNIVFNEYFYSGSREELLSGASDKKLEKLETAGVDTGMGLERISMAAQGKENVFETDLFHPILSLLPDSISARNKRIIADHARASVFLISDGIIPSNKGQGYILRRILRRIYIYMRNSGSDFLSPLAKVIELYNPIYNFDQEKILSIVVEEINKFDKTLSQGLRELQKLKLIDAPVAFNLFQSYGLPYEIIKDLSSDKGTNLKRDDFDAEFKKHQQLSRAGAKNKFGGHGLILDTGELKAANAEELKKVTRLHTATHMLQAALRQILGSEVHQAGSDITAERLRFDFTFPRKLTLEELRTVEDLVNQKVKEDLAMSMVEIPIEEARASGALTVDRAKYATVVKVYSIENFSREVCGGPHVAHTAEVGNFKIIKEESSSSGIRRIRAQVAD